MVDTKTQYEKIKPEVDKAVIEVLESTAFINGKPVQNFANNLSNYIGAKYTIPCANGTDALQIAIMALGLQPGVLYSSPLVRARDTAAILGKQFGLAVTETPLLAPGFNVNALERLVQGLAGDAEVMVVGHEPDFSGTIAALTGGGRVEMKKGGLARVDIIATDPLRGTLVWLLPPSIMDLKVQA